MVLRVLWLKENDSDTWKLIEKLMDNLDAVKDEDKTVGDVIDFIHSQCRLTQFKENEIGHIMGKLITIKIIECGFFRSP